MCCSPSMSGFRSAANTRFASDHQKHNDDRYFEKKKIRARRKTIYSLFRRLDEGSKEGSK